MSAILIFSVVLIAAVLLSGLAHRTVLSTTVLFLLAGFFAGDGMLGLVHLTPGDPLEATLAELALFSVLFTDGMRLGIGEIRWAWRLPGRALLFGLPLTMVAISAFAHFLTGLGWLESFLLGAALSPTDPVFASAVVGREEIPRRLRHLLNIESGLNDGLVLPVLLVLVALAVGGGLHLPEVATEVLLGIAAGIVIPWIVIRLEESRFFSAVELYQPLNAFAIGLLLFTVTVSTHSNQFLAAFAGGITVATISPTVRDSFHQFGELLAELMKLAAVFVFGVLISPELLGSLGASGYLFVAAVIFAARPIALAISLFPSELTWREWIAAAWFGPKGFASVLYALIILRSGIADAERIFHLAAVAIALSMLLHSSTDVPMVHWFKSREEDLGREYGRSAAMQARKGGQQDASGGDDHRL